VSARPDGIGGAVTTGDPDHPANFGRLCSKGFALEETLGLNGRLLHPMLRRADGSHAAARVIRGTYQSPILVQWQAAERQERRLDISIVRLS